MRIEQQSSTTAQALASTTTNVNVSSATAPTSGQVLTATSGTSATWQTPSGGWGGITWTEVTTTSQTAVVNNWYATNNVWLVTVTLPATAVFWSIIRIVGSGAGGWKLAQNASQLIVWDSGWVVGLNQTTTGVGGFILSTDRYDSIELLCIIANTTFSVIGSKGSPDIT